MEVMVDDIAEVLNAADARNILHQYFKAGKGEDPIVHFYETFLSEYDPATREKRGVYYTPEPVVRYIVRSVHQVLKSHFNLEDGLASRKVTLLDPAGGTLTFPAEAIRLAVNEFTEKYGDGGVHKLISEHILPNFYAFELMMAPYAIGHIKISFLLEELGYTMQDDERFKLYLTNTLDMEDLSQTRIPGLESLSDESHEAGKVKKNEPVLVIMGNPPYSANSSNYNDWTEKLLKENIDGAQSYYKLDGSPLNEHNPKLLQDDYVKFLRFAQWKIHKAGQGVVGMITNHGFLNNVTFRGMRQSLLNTFNEIYITDLHGDSQKKEKAPDGSKDENVFDITKGTAISIFIKKPGVTGCKISHNEIFGLRQAKYDWLENKEFSPGDYELLTPATPWYFFIPRNTADIEHYNTWPKLTEIFPVNSTGIKTHRDDFVIGFDDKELVQRLNLFSKKNIPDEVVRQAFNLKDNRDWKLSNARKRIFEEERPADVIRPIAYRPFDLRFIMYSEHLIDWPRKEVMQHMRDDNLAIVATRLNRQISTGYFFIADGLIDVHLLDNAQDSIIVAPLYLFSPIEHKRKNIIQNMMLFEPEPEYDKKGKKPNIAPSVFEALERSFEKKTTPEQIMHYCYGIMFSNIYREKYAEFLKIDFPRIPFTANHGLFMQMAGLGKELAQLHLLKSKSLDRPLVKYWGQGDDIIEKPVYKEESGRIYINSAKYFHGIAPEMWNYHIGGYKVLEKFLKDRKGQQMADSTIYCKIATAIAETIKIQAMIDPLFEEVENNLTEINLSK
jgi:predicted helicase